MALFRTFVTSLGKPIRVTQATQCITCLIPDLDGAVDTGHAVSNPRITIVRHDTITRLVGCSVRVIYSLYTPHTNFSDRLKKDTITQPIAENWPQTATVVVLWLRLSQPGNIIAATIHALVVLSLLEEMREIGIR